MTSPTPSQLLRQTFRSALTGGQRAYWLYLPPGYGDDDRLWPVILFLHGGGERGDDLDLVRKHGPFAEVSAGRDLPFILLGPQMPPRPTDAPNIPRPPMPPADVRRPMVRETPDVEMPWGPLGPGNGWHESEADLLHIVDRTLDAYQADPDRVYLTGLSYGGFGSWYMAYRHPDRWAAVAPLCGAGDPEQVTRIGRTPVWLFQGGRDPLVRPEWSLATAEALDRAGGDVRVTVHEDLAHDCWTRVYGGQDLYDWFLSHTRGGKP